MIVLYQSLLDLLRYGAALPDLQNGPAIVAHDIVLQPDHSLRALQSDRPEKTAQACPGGVVVDRISAHVDTVRVLEVHGIPAGELISGRGIVAGNNIIDELQLLALTDDDRAAELQGSGWDIACASLHAISRDPRANQRCGVVEGSDSEAVGPVDLVLFDDDVGQVFPQQDGMPGCVEQTVAGHGA